MIKIFDNITNIVSKFSVQYYKKGKLMLDTSENENIYDCPQCGKHSMEEVRFAKGYSTDDIGEPGLLCWVCHHMISGEVLEDYMTNEDDRREI